MRGGQCRPIPSFGMKRPGRLVINKKLALSCQFFGLVMQFSYLDLLGQQNSFLQNFVVQERAFYSLVVFFPGENVRFHY